MNYKLFLVAALTLNITGAAFAHSGATGVVKERMDAMVDLGERSKQVADMFKGKSEFDSTVILNAADIFVKHGTTLISLFPDTKTSRTGSKTEALPAIWEEWNIFSKQADEFLKRSESLQQKVSETNDPKILKAAFFKTAKTCSACHKRFRKPKR